MGAGVSERDFPLDLAGRVAIVTGAASGIGRAIALELGRWGARVAVADLNDAGAVETVAELGSRGVGALAVPLDVTDYAAVQRGFAFAAERLGPVELLVNAAGWDIPERFVDSQPPTWQRLIAINLMGVIHTTHVALPGMLERGFGRIVNIASDAGRVGSSGEAV